MSLSDYTFEDFIRSYSDLDNIDSLVSTQNELDSTAVEHPFDFSSSSILNVSMSPEKRRSLLQDNVYEMVLFILSIDFRMRCVMIRPMNGCLYL